MPVKPITPDDLASGRGKNIPDQVIEAFNELIAETGGRVLQDDVVKRILAKMPIVERYEVFKKGWLDIEGIYGEAGWKVVYDKPGYNETYKANWTFTRKR